MTTPLTFPNPGSAFAGVVSAMSSGPQWNAGLIEANRGRFSRLPQDQKRELWDAIKANGGISTETAA